MHPHDHPSLGNMIAPFNNDGTVHEIAYRRHIRYMSDGGTGVFIGGPHATEFVNMEPVERRKLWELAVEENKGKDVIYAIPFGPGSNQDMVSKFQLAKSLGFDGAQLYPAAQDGRGNDGVFLAEAERYFRDILETVDLPMFLCGYHGGEIIDGPNKQVTPELLRSLVDEYPHIVGVTVGPPNDESLRGFLEALAGTVPLRMAGALDWFQKMEMGVYGFHSIQQSIAPKLCSSMMAAFHRGEKALAKDLSDRIRKLNQIVHGPDYYYPRSIKPILNHLGFETGIIRLPYMPLADEVQKEIRKRIDEVDFTLEDLQR
ncbi:dihydrodipicolinate synthase family protein [Dehalococcoidia bacterium]|nr:dihydrodipicolinate synthase family protein [Dehalococcoidia bacterium]